MKNNIIFFLFFLLFISCGENEKKLKRGPKKLAIPVTGYVISSSEYTNIINTTGSFVSNEEIEIESSINGIILKINFQEGKPVSKGQLLVLLDAREYKSLLKSSEIKLQNLKKDFARQKEIYKLNGISLETLEATETNIAAEEANIEQLKVKIDYSEVRAPFSGIVGIREVSQGSYVLQGQKIARLVSNNPIKVDFALPSEYANQINLNTNIKVISKSTDDTLIAKVYAKDPGIDLSTRNVRIRAIANNPKGKYLPGDFVEILIEFAKMQSVLFVPNQAIVPKINEQTVFVVKNGIANETTVKTGIRNDKSVQILSGLNIGDTIMVTGLVNIKDKIPVKLTQILKSE